MAGVIRGSRNSVGRDAKNAMRVDGLKEIVKALEGIVDQATGARMKEVYYEAGVIFRDEARTRAPFDPKRKKGTHLRDAVFVSRGPAHLPDVLVGVRYFPQGAPHGHLVEYGSATREAHPFIRPAAVAVGPRVAEKISSGLIQIVDEFKR
jgi:HK97 gp10 family phage protein